MNEQHLGSEHTENEFAQDVGGSARGPVKGNEALPQIDAAVVMEMFNAFQSWFDNMEALMGRQSTINNPPVAPFTTNVQPEPQAPPPPSRERTVRDIKIKDFLKMKPPTFAREDARSLKVSG